MYLIAVAQLLFNVHFWRLKVYGNLKVTGFLWVNLLLENPSFSFSGSKQSKQTVATVSRQLSKLILILLEIKTGKWSLKNQEETKENLWRSHEKGSQCGHGTLATEGWFQEQEGIQEGQHEESLGK